jgi:uncharacterized protein YdaL
MDGFNEYSDVSLEKILGNLLDTKDIELKSEINDVASISVLKTLGDYLKSKKLPISSTYILDYIHNFLKYMVSYKRKGRMEIIDAVKGMAQNSLNMKDKMTKDLKDI